MRDQPIERNTLTPLYLKAASQIGRSDLSELATLEEGWFVELKERTPDPAKFAKSISSFAHSHGGLLVIGAKEEQKTRRLSSFSPMPRDFAVKCVERARDAVIAHISPPLYFDSNIIEIETIDRHAAERWIVVISIPKGNRGPYLHSNGCIYVRIGDASSPFPLSDLSLQERLWSESIKRRERIRSHIEMLSTQYRKKNPSLQLVILAEDINPQANSLTYAAFRNTVLSTQKKEDQPVFDQVQTLDTSFIARRTDKKVGGRNLLWEYDTRKKLHFVHIPIGTHRWDGESLDNFGTEVGLDQLSMLLRERDAPKDLIISNLFPALIILSLTIRKIQVLHQENDFNGLLKVNACVVDTIETLPFIGTSAYFDEVQSTNFPFVLRDTGFIWLLEDPSTWHSFPARAPSETIDSGNEYELANSLLIFALIAESAGISLQLSVGFNDSTRALNQTEIMDMFHKLVSGSFSYTSQENPNTHINTRRTDSY